MVPVGFVSDHMEVIYDLDTEAMATAEKLGLEAVRAATPGIDPRFVAMVRDLLVERAAVERGEEVARSTVGRPAAPGARSAPPAAAPTRAASARPSAGPDCVTHDPVALRDLALRPSRARRPRWPSRCAAAASTSPTPSPAPSTSSPRPTAPCEELIRRRLLERAARRRDPGRGGRRPPRHQRGPLGRRPDRRHRQLPLRPARLRRLDRRGGRRRGRRRRGRRRIPTGVEYAAAPRPRRHPRRRADRGPARPAARRDAGRSPASATAPRSAPTRRRRVARLLPRVRDIRRMGSCALDLCHVAEGSGDAYVEEGPARWDWAAGVPGRDRGRGRVRPPAGADERPPGPVQRPGRGRSGLARALGDRGRAGRRLGRLRRRR